MYGVQRNFAFCFSNGMFSFVWILSGFFRRLAFKINSLHPKAILLVALTSSKPSYREEDKARLLFGIKVGFMTLDLLPVYRNCSLKMPTIWHPAMVLFCINRPVPVPVPVPVPHPINSTHSQRKDMDQIRDRVLILFLSLTLSLYPVSLSLAQLLPLCPPLRLNCRVVCISLWLLLRLSANGSTEEEQEKSVQEVVQDQTRLQALRLIYTVFNCVVFNSLYMIW